MRKIFLVTAFLFGLLNASAQVGIGLRDNQFAYIYYKFKENWDVRYEHSLFKGKIKYQYFRLSASYRFEHKWLTLQGRPYWGITYNRDYYNLGANLSASADALKWLNVHASLNPHYDSGMGYETCFAAGLGFKVHKHISIITDYTTIPEYRMSEKRIRAGLHFKVGNLQVTPMLSFPATSDVNSFRVLASLDYLF